MTYKEQMDQEYKKGLEQGELSGKVLARFEDGMSIETIAERTGREVEDVEEILKEKGKI